MQPGLVKNEIGEVDEGALRIKTVVGAVKGKANKALIDFLAEESGVKKSKVEIISGHTTRLKRIKVIGEGTKTKEKIWGLTTLQS